MKHTQFVVEGFDFYASGKNFPAFTKTESHFRVHNDLPLDNTEAVKSSSKPHTMFT
jgi:hypothetical protein